MTTLLFTQPSAAAPLAGLLWTALLLALAILLIWSAGCRKRRLEHEKRHHRLTPKRAKKMVQE